MTKEVYVFSFYMPCSGKQKVQVANGSFTLVSGKGNVFFSLKISLLYDMFLTCLAIYCPLVNC